jgi:predicted enzyme related to lactoylglutathione lyase
MAKATGIGGVFLRAKDPEALYRWYEEHLGITKSEGGFMFMGAEGHGLTVFALFPADTDYFGPGKQAAMINFRVDDMDGVMAKLKSAGMETKQEDSDYGRFGWFTDPEGNRVELWEEKPEAPTENL